MNEQRTTSSYWINSDQQIQSATKPIEDKIEARIERLDLQFVNPDKRPNPKYEVLFVGQLHPDEDESAEIFDQQTSQDFQFPHLKVMEAHAVASMFRRREFPAPLPEEELNNLNLKSIQNIVILVKGHLAAGLDEVIDAYHSDTAKEKLETIFKINPNCAEALALQYQIKIIRDLTNSNKIAEAQQRLDTLKPKLIDLAHSSEWVLAKQMNLNRQFPISENAANWTEVAEQISYPEAKMFLQLIKDNPLVKYLFSIHEDLEHGADDFIIQKQNKGKEDLLLGTSGTYFYDAHFYADDDPDKDLIQELRNNLSKKLMMHGFQMLDDASDNDPNIGLTANHGYINHPNINMDGKKAKTDNSLESAFVEIGRLGLTGKNGEKIQAQRAFCIEIPGRLEPARKAELLKIYQDELIIPFLAAHGIS